ncbi:hypothetical protein EDF67_1011125 [Sphingobacterium sp. JUb78]|nr:hypothetical protein [Sphingobacterium kitahiroshimense]TCR15018.1 hypothetical protein EDF67_1011125 [Sphingobacterium sp. JUb78]
MIKTKNISRLLNVCSRLLSASTTWSNLFKDTIEKEKPYLTMWL